MLILCHSLWEPKGNFLLCRFYSIGSMDDIAANVNAKVPADGARRRRKRVGSTDDQSSSFNHLFSFPHHAHHRSRADVIHQSREERFGREICIVFFCQGLFDHFHLQRFEEVPFFFKPLDDLSHQSTLHAIWLDHDVGSFHGACFFRRLRLLAMARSSHSSLPALVPHEMVSLLPSLLSTTTQVHRQGMAADPPIPFLTRPWRRNSRMVHVPGDGGVGLQGRRAIAHDVFGRRSTRTDPHHLRREKRWMHATPWRRSNRDVVEGTARARAWKPSRGKRCPCTRATVWQGNGTLHVRTEDRLTRIR